MSRWVVCLCVILAAVAGIGVGTVLPTALAQKADRPGQTGRYAGRMQPVLGGIGGVVIEVTDHETNTLYLYITKTEWGKEKKAEADESPFELTAKVDLTSAGQARLKVTDIKPDDKKQK